MDLSEICRIFQPPAAQYTFFLVVRGTFSTTDDILRHKASLNKYKKIEITLLHFIKPQWNKTRSQQQKKPQKNTQTHED
jgi:hypothetical protein